MTAITKPGIYPDIPEADYHADPVPDGSMSSSMARTILKSPAHLKWEQDHPTPPTRAMDFGSAAHRMALGKGAGVVKVDVDAWRTKDAKDAKAAIEADGLIAVKAAEYQIIEDMAAALTEHPVASALLKMPGSFETTLVWQDRCWRRARIDNMPDSDGKRVYAQDYKTAADGSTEAFEKATANLGYHQQAAWYTDGIRALLGVDAVLLFIVQEKTPPYLVNVIELSPATVDIGRERNERAVDIWLRCRETGVWPGYGTDINQATLPTWAFYQHETNLNQWSNHAKP